jgi:hypothetical protein
MIDTIPAKTQQLIAIFTRKMFSNDVQIGKLRSFDSPIYLILVFVFSLLAYQVG